MDMAGHMLGNPAEPDVQVAVRSPLSTAKAAVCRRPCKIPRPS